MRPWFWRSSRHHAALPGSRRVPRICWLQPTSCRGRRCRGKRARVGRALVRAKPGPRFHYHASTARPRAANGRSSRSRGRSISRRAPARSHPRRGPRCPRIAEKRAFGGVIANHPIDERSGLSTPAVHPIDERSGLSTLAVHPIDEKQGDTPYRFHRLDDS